MTLRDLEHVRPSEILAKLRPGSERRIHATYSRRKTWPKMIAWNPARELTFRCIDPAWRAKLRRFVAEQRRCRRFIVGFFSYDLGLHRLGIRPRDRAAPGLPDGYLAAFGNYLSGADGGLRTVAEDRKFLAEVEAILRRPAAPVPPGPVFDRPFRSRIGRAEYRRAFRTIQRHIRAGDVYQLNLTHRLEGRTGLDPLAVFRRVRDASPRSLLALIEGEDHAVISASPERFVRIADGAIMTAPIKGTRPRGRTAAEDRRLRSELLSSEKERAELNMITDLLRNDLGTVCRPGSVKVTARRKLTAHPTIWHTHSEIAGRLLPGLDPLDALVDLLPGGSISGCPKRRALEIIDRLEPVPRGVYTGTLVTIDPAGTLDASIVIRTLLQRGRHAYLSVGGGIVHGATESAEYQESLDKAKVFTEL
ncbi:MAG: anthranilate synthase component I family protein [Patescibacteria group bacterium]